jgi:phage terminase small subunit
MSEDKPVKPKKRNGPIPPPKTERLKLKQLPKLDLKAELEAIELDEETSRKAKLRRLLDLRAKCLTQLNPQQQTFVTEYFVDFNQSKACARAGYSPEYAKSGDLMRLQAIVDYITITSKVNELKIEATAEFVLDEFHKLAKVKASDLYDSDGHLIPPHLLPDWVAAAVSEVKQKTTPLINGKEMVEYTYKLHSKVAALDALGKHTGIYERDNKQRTPEAASVVIYMPENGREVKTQES